MKVKITGASAYPVTLQLNGVDITYYEATHSEKDIPAVINLVDPTSVDINGARVTVSGFGFFGKSVFWGEQKIEDVYPDPLDNTFKFIAPASAAGVVQVSVQDDTDADLASGEVAVIVEVGGPLPIDFTLASVRNTATLSILFYFIHARHL